MGQQYLLTKHFWDTVARRGNHTALMEKVGGQYQPTTYREMNEKVEQLAAYLVQRGLQPQDKVALLSENRVAWPVSDLGIISAGLVCVPLYPTLTAAQVAYILNNSEAKGIIVSKPLQLDKIASIYQEVPSLEFVIVIDDYAPVSMENVHVLSWAQMLAEGQSHLAATRPERENRLKSAQEGDTVSIIYTSGTTGDPKGVMLSHKNFASNARAAAERLALAPQAIALSFLPLSHVLERVLNYASQYIGIAIAYAESIDTISQNLQEIHPHTFAGVPRVFEKIYNRVIDQIEAGSPLKQKIFHWALGVGKQRLKYVLENKPVPGPLALQYALATKLVFHKIHARTGGNIQYVISGGAPLMKEIAEFFFAVGIPIYEGYGLTETSPVITCNCPGAARLGTVGKPLPGIEVRIAEDGEILAKGPNIMQGYYKMPEDTASTIVDGWLHTGDIGELDSDGFLRITDRKKELLIMSNGKNVAPQPIENRLKSSPLIEQAILLGNNERYIAALIYPNYENVKRQLSNANGSSQMNPAELAQREDVQELIRREIDRLMKDCARYEQIKKFHLLTQELTQDDGSLTPTLKYKRRIINERFAEEIRQLFKTEEVPSEVG